MNPIATEAFWSQSAPVHKGSRFGSYNILIVFGIFGLLAILKFSFDELTKKKTFFLPIVETSTLNLSWFNLYNVSYATVYSIHL
jgi:hypothetical protein